MSDHATHRFRGQRTRSAHLEHEAAKGFRPWGPKRSRSGAITRLFNSALAASCGRALNGSQQEARGDAAPTGPQASKSVRGVIGHFEFDKNATVSEARTRLLSRYFRPASSGVRHLAKSNLCHRIHACSAADARIELCCPVRRRDRRLASARRKRRQPGQPQDRWFAAARSRSEP